MKIKFLMIMLLGLTGVFCKANPRLIQREETVDRDGKQYRKIIKHFFFHQSEMTYHYLTDSGRDLVKRKWGDFELGLRHGRIQNGSWCMWNFFSCVMPDKKGLTDRVPAEKVAFMSTASGVHAEIIWPELTLKMVQLKSVREWIFMEVTTRETPAFLRLRAWPGGAKWKRNGGEVRRLMTQSLDMSIPSTQKSYSESSGGLALYNWNYSERNGNFLVFEPEKFQETFVSANNMVMLDFVPKPGEKVFHFALGYFLDEDPQDACGRFLRERLPDIIEFLKHISWIPQADFSDFSRNIEVVEKILAADVLSQKDKAIFQEELSQCQKRFRQAEKEQDIPAAYHEVEVSGKLRSRIGAAAMKYLH